MKKDNELKKKLVKKGVAVLVAGTLIATVFTGCGKRGALLEDTILEKSAVVYVDDQPLVMSYYPYSDNCNGKHYKDIVSGEIYHVKNENYEGTEICEYKDIKTLDPDTKIESITPYLTADELKKAQKDEFTDADIIEIEQRISNQSKTLN